MQKAMELNGKKVMGQEVKLDKARSKENAQEGKKGKCLPFFKYKLVLKMLFYLPMLTVTYVPQREMRGHSL